MPQQSKVTYRASDVEVEFFELLTSTGTFNILPQLISFNMFEDMYSPNLNIEIGLNDSVNLPFLGPIVGEEYLNFRFATKSSGGTDTQSEIWPGDMYLTTIKNRHIAKDRQQIYVLRFTSSQGIINHNTTISKSYKGQRIDQIIEDIASNYLDLDDQYDYNIDQTKGIENIIIPNWKPFEAIDWLCQRAINENNVPNFLYWESNGEVYFKSVDTLVQNEPIQKFRFNPLSNDTTKLEASKAGVMELDKLRIDNQFNVIHNIDNGYYASKLITHDIVRKKIEEGVKGLDEFYDGSVNHTDPYMPISSSETAYSVPDRVHFAKPLQPSRKSEGINGFFDSNTILWPKHNQMYAENVSDFYDNKAEDWLLQRNMLMNSLNQIKLNIEFPAISGLQVGHMVEIIVPAATQVLKNQDGSIKNKEELTDRILSGNYLITSINHSISFLDKTTTNRYRMICELTKDGIGSPIAGGVQKR
tara:strand:+ start:17220 stop:18635 length:1416 start_codon:yes stop_codon:yes gene_type:complete